MLLKSCAVAAKDRRDREACVVLEVVDDDRRPTAQDESVQRPEPAGCGLAADDACLPADAGPEDEPVRRGPVLEDSGELDVERLRHLGRDLGEQRAHDRGVERDLRQTGGGRLSSRVRDQLRLEALALGEVLDDAPQADERAAVEDRAREDEGRKRRAVLAPGDVLARRQRRSAEHPADALGADVPLVGFQQVEHEEPGAQLVLAVAEGLERGPVGEPQAEIRTHLEDGLRQRVGVRLQQPELLGWDGGGLLIGTGWHIGVDALGGDPPTIPQPARPSKE